MKNEIKGMIICGFPGIWKTTAAAKARDVTDLESSVFHYHRDENGFIDGENPDWVSNYVDCIALCAGEYGYQYVLASCHKAVRDELESRGIPYVVVVPEKSLKDEYLIRYLRRGDLAEFMETVNDHWDEWLTEIDQGSAPVIHLTAGQVLQSILP